jgi:predicted nucleic acid-binding protein
MVTRVATQGGVSRAAALRMRLQAARGTGLRLMFDASALTKRYASEPGHARVLALFESAGELLVAAHCQTELASALLRRRRDGSLPEREFDRAWTAARRDVADMTRVPLDADVERFAFAAMEHSPLREVDALHVGSALAAGVDMFVTADRRQADVARKLGLQAELVDEDMAVPVGIAMGRQES